MVHTRAAKISFYGILVIALFIFNGCGSKDTGQTDIKKTTPVTVSVAKKANISSTIVITGKVTPQFEVMIVPKVGGKVSQVPVDVGSRIKKGSLLVKLETTDQELSLSGGRVTHDQAVLNYNNAKANYERNVALFNQGAISKKDLEMSELAYRSARETVSGAQIGIANVRNQISNATITSPIDGEVATRTIDPGEMAGPTQPVMTVVNIDKVFVEGTVAESDISLIKEGQKVTVKVEAAGGSFDGIIKTLSPVANAQTKGYPVKVEISNTDRKLKPGMFAEIHLVTKNKDDVIVVPKEALVTRGSDKILYVVKNNVVEERTVQTGIESDDRIEIVKGLAAGDKFVIEGQQALFDKAKVTIRTGDTSG